MSTTAPLSRFDVIAEAVRGITALPAPRQAAPGVPPDVFVPQQVERVTHHDFALFETVFDPWAARDPRPAPDPAEPPTVPASPAVATPPPPVYLPEDLVDLRGLSVQAEAVLAYFLDAEVREALQEGVPFEPAPLIRLIHRFRTTCYGEMIRHYQPAQIPVRLESMLIFFVEKFLADLAEVFPRMDAAQQARFYADYYDRALRDWVLRTRDLEMPWLVGNWNLAEWTRAGYVVGEVFGLIPRELSGATNSNGVRTITWLRGLNGAPDPLPHEHAWSFFRSRTAIEFGRYDTTRLYFSRFDDYSPRGGIESAVLKGAVTILAEPARVAPSELEKLTDSVRAMLGQYGNVLGASAYTAPRTARDVYGFEPYPTGSINLGLRVLYRQAWTPRGIQPGELVRTLPLAPGQKERISIKIHRRDKITREFEETSGTETTDESVNTTKDSSEVVEEAARANKWHVDATASGSFNVGIFSVNASTSTGYAQDSSKSSRDTKTRLAESVQKTARTSRRQTRIKVSTESEQSFESERSTEITNPNQEIAVTCFYETVQQIYTVKTGLEGVDPVVFVAERVPAPAELNLTWLRRHDWILNRALLDESFRETLALVSAQPPDFARLLSAEALGLDEVARLSKVLEKAEASLATIHQLPGNIANTYEATLNAYQSAVVSARARLDELQRLLHRVQRLSEHVADNILHYCRAIWAEEDPERRRMRYASLRLPTRFFPSLNLQTVETDPLTGATIYTGAWSADPTSWAPLAELIHPAGPIAYSGNYAVYRLRYLESTAGLSRVIRLASQAYFETVPPAATVSPAARAGALQITVTVENEDFYPGANYTLQILPALPPAPQPPPVGGPPLAAVPAQPGLQLSLYRQNANGLSDDLTLTAAPNAGRIPALQLRPITLLFDGLRLEIRGGVQAGDVITLRAQRPLLVDPEIKYRRLLDPQLPLDQITRELEAENTEDVVVDTNNLWLNLVKGTGTALEDFKLAHRQIDVETSRAELIRRYLRLDQNVLTDPDIEKKVIIHGPAHPAHAAASEATAVEPPPLPPPLPPN